MYENFTSEAIKAIMLAQEESRRLGHNFVGTEQVLLGLTGETAGIGGQALREFGVKRKDTRVEVEKIIGRGSGFVAVEIPFTPRAKRVVELANAESRRMGCSSVDTEHLALGILDEGGGVALQVLENLEVDLVLLREKVIDLCIEKKIANSSDRGMLLLPIARVTGQTMSSISEFRDCPACDEQIRASAIHCRYCEEGLSEEHFKRCPYCAESVRKTAAKCRHCQSDLTVA